MITMEQSFVVMGMEFTFIVLLLPLLLSLRQRLLFLLLERARTEFNALARLGW